jgi:hypothetical protein
MSSTETSLDVFGFLNVFKYPKILPFRRAQTRQVTLHINAQKRVTNLKLPNHARKAFFPNWPSSN